MPVRASTRGEVVLSRLTRSTNERLREKRRLALQRPALNPVGFTARNLKPAQPVSLCSLAQLSLTAFRCSVPNLRNPGTRPLMSYLNPPLGPLALAVGIATSIGCGATTATSTGPSPVKCTVSLTTADALLDGDGGTSTLTVSTQPECSWTAMSETNWISDLSPRQGQGPAEVAFRVTPNSVATAREGNILVNDSRVLVKQGPATCRFEVRSTEQPLPAEGGDWIVIVTTLPGCSWSASSDDPWMSIAAGATGSSSGAVSIIVDANTGPERQGTLTIAGQALSVIQAAAPQPGPAPSPAPGPSPGPSPSPAPAPGPAPAPTCSYTIDPTSASTAATGGTPAPVTVTTAAGCVWAATSQAPWITITSGATGTGTGSVRYSVAANAGDARSGTLTIAGQTFTVSQASRCTFSISPTSQSFDFKRGEGSVSVATDGGCAWTATITSGASWIVITDGSSGTGTGTVAFRVAQNQDEPRTGTLTIAGHTFTIRQDGKGQ